MIPALLIPAGLFALAALAIPLLLHLARRTERRPTDFAALRWLRAHPRPRQRPRFEEWPLLAARLMLLTLLALWLARPAALAPPHTRARVYVVPGVAPSAAASLVKAGAEGRWLSPGFPPLDRPAPNEPVAVASLVRQLDAELPAAAPVHVLVPAIIEGADGELLRLSRRVDWRVAPGAMPRRSAHPLHPPALAVHGEGEGRRYLLAAATSWQAPGAAVDSGPIDAPPPERGVALAWLGAGAMPAPVAAWVESGGTALVRKSAEPALFATAPVLVAMRDAGGMPLVEQVASGKGRVLRFTARLTPAAMPALVEPDFADRLRALLAEPRPAPGRIAAADLVPLVAGVHVDAPAPRLEWRPWLALLIAATLLVERWLASGRRRGNGP